MKPLKEREHKLTRWEQQLEDELMRGEWVPSPPEEQERLQKMVAEFRKNYRKNKVLNIRINSIDLAALKAKAQKAGKKYQTYITDILHKVAHT
jgi:predicted DNA binding CopG/RHH family protein